MDAERGQDGVRRTDIRSGGRKCTCRAHNERGELQVGADGVPMVGGPRCFWTRITAAARQLVMAAIRIEQDRLDAEFEAGLP
jgi:hypothetical protein